MEFQWEDINSIDEDTQRLRVFNGWLVRTFNGDWSAVAMVFIADPDHEWDIE